MSAVATAKSPPSSKNAPLGVPIHLDEGIVIPTGIVDHESYRRWSRSDSFPRRGRFAFFNESLWVDRSMEQAYTHNLVKFQIGRVLATLVDETGSGHFFADGMQLSNLDCGLTTVPDGLFVSFDALDSKRIVEVSGAENGCVEFEGTPDMVLEVVSRFSEQKDTAFISLYYDAGIPEYWFVDVRKNPVRFDIYVHGARKYVAARRQAGGWLKSNVFGRSFRLTPKTDRRGKPIYLLEVRE